MRRIIQRVVAEQRDERRELDGLRVIGMDEISYRKRHKYLTVVIDHLSGRVVWAGKERKAKTLLRFFCKLTATKNQVENEARGLSFVSITRPTPLQHKAFNLLEINPRTM